MRIQRTILTLVIGLLVLMGVSCTTSPPTGSPSPTPIDTPKPAPITEAEVNAAQQAWCDGLVAIGKVYKDGGDYKTFASRFIDDTYDFKDGRVFFRPTLAVAPAGAPRGHKNGNFRNGNWTADAIEERRWLRSLVQLFATTG